MKAVSECDYCHGSGWVDKPQTMTIVRFKPKWNKDGYFEWEGQRVKYGDPREELYEHAEIVVDAVDRCPCSI